MGGLNCLEVPAFLQPVFRFPFFPFLAPCSQILSDTLDRSLCCSGAAKANLASHSSLTFSELRFPSALPFPPLSLFHQCEVTLSSLLELPPVTSLFPTSCLLYFAALNLRPFGCTGSVLIRALTSRFFRSILHQFLSEIIDLVPIASPDIFPLFSSSLLFFFWLLFFFFFLVFWGWGVVFFFFFLGVFLGLGGSCFVLYPPFPHNFFPDSPLASSRLGLARPARLLSFSF